MRKLLVVFVFTIGLTSAAFGQKPNQARPSNGILGYFDPRTGTFKPMVPAEDAVNPALVTPTTGKFVFNLTITISSTSFTSASVTCDATVSVGGTDFYTEQADVPATGSGSSRTCSVTVPYSWLLSSPTTDTVTLSYSIEAINDTTFAERLNSHTIGSIKVPATGTTTTETFAVTI